ncbi:MAG TPA: alkaline phosphatase PhoX, partial [Phototrophicaceae bacterium]|nr:alkaline phosphatase PhoX [Phototrophicaceae bacterium]
MKQTNQKNVLRNLIQGQMSRRNFLRGASVMGAGAVAGIRLPGGVVSAAATSGMVSQVGVGTAAMAAAAGLGFTPIAPGAADELVLPEGFTYEVVVKRGDVFTKDGRVFGDNSDWTGWFPIDGAEGGNNAEEGILVVNNEYYNSMFVSGFTGADGEKRTAEQVAQEKAAIGICSVHLKKVDGKWTVVTDSEVAHRFDATDKILLSGPVAGADAVNGATEVVGTLANCSGGKTPWLTGLSCEENYQDYYGEDKNKPGGAAGWVDAGANTDGQI